jgi:hypothetical protein
MLTYEYECSKHGVVEIKHSIKDDRKRQECPRGVRVYKATPPGWSDSRCRLPLKPLISSGGAHKDHPAVFRGGGWEFKDQPQYKEYHVTTTRDDPLGTRAAKERRDPAAVR